MKKRVPLILISLLIGCSESNQITEMGNPKSHPSTLETTSATSQAIINGILGSLTSIVADESDDGFVCSYNEEAFHVVCQCREGGTITKDFGDTVSVSDGEASLADLTTVTYDNCTVSACGETVALNGLAGETLIGSYHADTGSEDLTVAQHTSETFSGMTAGEETFGFNVVLRFGGLDSDLSGELCLERSATCLTFNGLDELQTLVDPDNECPGGFDFDSLEDEFDENTRDETEQCHQCFEDCYSGDNGDACVDQCRGTGLCE